MGWADCGTDSKGRRIGYAFGATCDYEGCEAKIDRGLSYVCGGMHGEGGGNWKGMEWGCEGYFCEKHRDTPYCAHCDEAARFELCLTCCKEAMEYIGDDE